MGATAIIQARMGSNRLPGKVLAPLGDYTVLEHMVARVRLSHKLKCIIVATTAGAVDDPVERLAAAAGVAVWRGSEHDVLDRYVCATRAFEADPVIRLTADCPLIVPSLIDEAIETYERREADYVYVEGYPLGLGEIEVVRAEALERTWRETTSDDCAYREHVTGYIVDHPGQFTVRTPRADKRYHRPDWRLTVDEPADLEVVRVICAHFASCIDFTLEELFAFLDERPDIVALNRHVHQRRWAELSVAWRTKTQ